jgi:hypothetical protein
VTAIGFVGLGAPIAERGLAVRSSGAAQFRSGGALKREVRDSASARCASLRLEALQLPHLEVDDPVAGGLAANWMIHSR